MEAILSKKGFNNFYLGILMPEPKVGYYKGYKPN